MIQEEKKAYLDVEVMIFDPEKPTKRISIPVDCSRTGNLDGFFKRVSVMNTPAVKMWMVGSMKAEEDSPPADTGAPGEFEQWLMEEISYYSTLESESKGCIDIESKIGEILCRKTKNVLQGVLDKYKTIKK